MRRSSSLPESVVANDVLNYIKLYENESNFSISLMNDKGLKIRWEHHKSLLLKFIDEYKHLGDIIDILHEMTHETKFIQNDDFKIIIEKECKKLCEKFRDNYMGYN